MAQLVPYTGGEKESLQASLDRHRDAVLWKLEGLDDAELRRPMLTSGNTLLGLIKHLATWEYAWICRTFGPPTEPLTLDEGADYADLRVNPEESTADILAFYERARTAVNQVISKVDLDETGATMFGDTVSLRWALIHMLEDTARHAGHIDIMREIIDGKIRRPSMDREHELINLPAPHYTIDHQEIAVLILCPHARTTDGPDGTAWESLRIERLHDLLKQELHFCRDRSSRIASFHESETFFNGVVSDLAVQQRDVLCVGLHRGREELHCQQVFS